jgi:hypothetical protein
MGVGVVETSIALSPSSSTSSNRSPDFESDTVTLT